MICRPLILVFTVLAFSRAQDSPLTANIFPIPVKAVVLNFNPIECNSCRGGNPGAPNILCGSDGQNYYNFEKLNCVNKCKGTNVQFAYYGQCRKDSDFAQSKIKTDSEPLSAPIPAVPVPPVAPLIAKPPAAVPPMLVAPTTVPPMLVAPTTVPPVSAPAAPSPPPVSSGCPCMKNIGRDEPEPFCADDGYTYQSETEASCIGSCYGKDIQKIHDGPCVRNEKCKCQPSSISDPICGTDGNTYMNRQTLDCHNYCNKQRVQQLFKGKCGGFASYSANIYSSWISK